MFRQPSSHQEKPSWTGLTRSAVALFSTAILSACNQSPSSTFQPQGRLPAESMESAFVGAAAVGDVDVLTNRYNNARTGATLVETKLHTGNVNAQQFGKLFTRPVVGQIYASPLVVSNLTMGDGTTRNVVFVGTMRNNLYAFDADDASNSAPLWQKSMGPSFPFTDYGDNHDVTDHVGILSTPVIDRATNTLYVLAATKENNQYFHKLHAIDIRTGNEKANSPVTVQGSVPASTSDVVNGQLAFNSKMHMQRPGLLLTQGKIVFAFASHFDQLPYHGWVFAYDAQTLARTAITVASNSSQGVGIWQSGSGLSTDDAGNIFAVTGNGFGSDATKEFDRTESIVKWSLQGLTQLDYFTPSDWKQLDDVDDDLGVDGAMLIPGTNYVISGAKSGTLYLLDKNNMGRLQPNNAGARQVFQGVYNNGSRHIHGNPIFWNGPQGRQLFVWGENDFLRAFSLRSDNYFTPQAVSQSTMRAVQNSMPGGIITVSSNGSQAGIGVVWANLVLEEVENNAIRPGILRAFDASDLSHELWNSEQNPGRDKLGYFAKFAPPVVANGKVYMATFSGELAVYGLLPNQPATNPIIAPLRPEPVAPPTGAVTIRSKAGDLCMTLPNATAGTTYTVTACANAATQSFQLNLAGEIRAGAFCTDAFGGNGASGDAIGAWNCAGSANQKWNLLSNGELRGINGKCLTLKAASAGSGLSIENCTGAVAQQWTLTALGTNPPPPPPPPPPTGDWVTCAKEGERCSFTGTLQVRYGFGTTWVTKTLTGGTACTNDVFGDPLVGTAKICQIPATTTPIWTFCAIENAQCSFTGTMLVRYGAGSTWVTKTLTGGTPCTNGVFGDPIVGVQKQCQTAPVPTTGWTFCAIEGAQCNFTGTKTVRYGAGSTWVTKTLTGGTACTNDVFGDPLVGVQKQCEISN